MSAYQLISYLGVPLTVLLVLTALTAFARPDRTADGGYVSYLGFAQILALYTLMLSLTSTAETVAGHIVIGDAGQAASTFGNGALSGFAASALSSEGELSPAFATGLLALAMVVVFTFHARRRSEVLADDVEAVEAVDRAYRGAVCFAMVSLAVIAAMVIGPSAYEFFDQPVGASSQARDLAGFGMVIYGALLVATFVIFRAHFWDIRPGRGNDEADGGVATVGELDG